MAETRHRTVVEIGVDDREVRGLGATLDRTFGTDAIEAFNRSLDRTSRTLQKLMETQTRLGAVLTRMDQTMRQQGGQGGRGRGGGIGVGGVALGTWLGHQVPQMVSRPAAFLGAAAQGQGLSQAFGGIPLVGPALGGGIAGIMQFYQAFVAREMARARSFGQTGVGRLGGFGRTATGFGLMPGEQFGALSEMAQGTGLRGPDLMRVAPRLLEYRELMGFGSLGQVVSGAQAAGGREDAAETIETSVAAGVAAGFREGRLDRFFAQFGAWVEGVRTQGIDLSADAAASLVGAVSGLGASFRGEAGLRAAQGMQQAFGGRGMRQGPLAMLMLRAQNVGQPGGPTVMQARATIAANPRLALERARPLITAQLGGGSTSGFAQILENLAGEMGWQLSPQQVLDIATAWNAGRSFEPGDQPRGTLDQARRRAGMRGGRGGVFGAAATAAGLEVQRADLGGRLAPAATLIQREELRLARAVAPQIARVVTWMIKQIRQVIDALVGSEGQPGLVETVGEDISRSEASTAATALRAYQAMPQIMQEAVRAGAELLPGVSEETVERLGEMTPAQIDDMVYRLERQSRGMAPPRLNRELQAPYGSEYSPLRPDVGPEDPEALRRYREERGIPVGGVGEGTGSTYREPSGTRREGPPTYEPRPDVPAEPPPGPQSAADLIRRGAELIHMGARLLETGALPGEAEFGVG